MRAPRGSNRGLVAPFIFCVLSTTHALAQTTGQVWGLVTDPKGTPLAGVVIVVDCPSQAIDGRGAVTDATGAFQVPGLPPARDSSVRATLTGFATVRLSDLSVSAGQASVVRPRR